MKPSSQNFCLATALLVLFLVPRISNSQYYYKDILSTDQTNRSFQLLSKNKIANVTLNSFNGNIPDKEGFIGWQKISYKPGRIITYTKTANDGESWLTTTFNEQGLLTRTVDSTAESVSRSYYQYNAARQLIQLRNETVSADKSAASSEIHTWSYSGEGRPQQMLRIKNGRDTTLTRFAPDEKGNPGEEETFIKGNPQGKTYYYYDAKGRLTDVVRYNVKAARLLPDYVFEYEENNELSTMVVVPEGSSDYQKWYYKYDKSGLKLAEFCYNKKSELLGKIEYEYR